MDDFLNKEGRKVSASHDTNNYYPPSSESASLSHAAFGAQVGGGSTHEGHCHYGPGNQKMLYHKHLVYFLPPFWAVIFIAPSYQIKIWTFSSDSKICSEVNLFTKQFQ